MPGAAERRTDSGSVLSERKKFRPIRRRPGPGRTTMVSGDYLFVILLSTGLYMLIHMIDASICWRTGHSWRH